MAFFSTNENILLIPARSRLFAKFVTTVLEPRLYDATLVGYTFSLKSYIHGLTLSFGGLSGSMSSFIDKVNSGMWSQFIIILISCTLLKILLFLVFSRQVLTENGALFNAAKADLVNRMMNYNYTQLAFRYTYRYLQQ